MLAIKLFITHLVIKSYTIYTTSQPRTAHVHIHTCVHAHLHTRTHTYACTHTHTHIHTHTCTHTHHVHTHIHTHHVHTHIHTNTYKHMYAHARVHTHTHTLTHIQTYILIFETKAILRNQVSVGIQRTPGLKIRALATSQFQYLCFVNISGIEGRCALEIASC